MNQRKKEFWAETIVILILALLCFLLFHGHAPAAELPCFEVVGVDRAISNDSGRYVLRTVSRCKHPIDIYVKLMFRFQDDTEHLGFESLHFVQPGPHRNEFAYPLKTKSVWVLGLVNTLAEAMQ